MAWSSPQMLKMLFLRQLWKHSVKMDMHATQHSTSVPAARNNMAACQKPLATSANVRAYGPHVAARPPIRRQRL